jgi:hypothetical protein
MQRPAFARLAQLTFILALCSATLGLLAPSLWAQSAGSVVGTITDASQAAIPGTPVTLTSVSTAEHRPADTDANGNYSFTSVPPGEYRIDIEKPGFKHFTRTIDVQVDTVVRADARMELGDISQTIEISSQAALLQTDSASLSQVVEGRQVLEMPLNGRNVLNLAALVPGVVPQGGTAGSLVNNQNSSSFTNPQGWGNYQIGGGQAANSSQYLDGVSVATTFRNAPGFVPTQDAIQEFRVVTNDVSPEYGKFAGGVISLVTKSGTNAFHGTAYEYFRNTVLDANNFFNNANGLARPALHQHQYGAAGGGPVKKDKMFFYFSWEKYQRNFGIPVLGFVPTPAQLAGDFSGAKVPQIYDPISRVVNAAGTALISNTPFSGNMIPPSRIDSTAYIMANTIKEWALPNVNSPGGNFANNAASGGRANQYNTRVDYTLSQKQRLFARYGYWTTFTPGENVFNDTPQQGQGTHQPTSSDLAVLGDTITFSPTTVADFRLSYLRLYFELTPSTVGEDLTQFGPAWARLQPQVTTRELPGLTVTGFLGAGSGIISPSDNDDTGFSGNLTKIAGRHTWKFGGEIRHDYFAYAQANEASGAFTFTSAFTSATGLSGDPTGQAMASFMLGFPSQGLLQTYLYTGELDEYQGYYFNDTFQVNRKLTLNYGVRWELPGVWTARHDNGTVLLPGVPDPLAKTTGLPLTGQLGLLNSSLYPDNHVQNRNFHLFTPRLGIAYRLNDKTVIRLGFARSYLPTSITLGQAPTTSPVNVALTTMNATVNGFTPVDTLSNPYPNGVLQPYGHNPAFTSTVEGNSISAGIPSSPFPQANQWNFSVGRQLGQSGSLDVAYSGNRGTHLNPANGGINLNAVPDQYDALGHTALTTAVPNPFYGLLPTLANSTLTGKTIRYGQLLKPYPQYVNVSNASSYEGSALYNSLQAKFQYRLASGVTILASYSWSKILGTADAPFTFLEQQTGAVQDPNNLNADKSLSSFDVPQRIVFSYVLDAPFGKGKRFLGNVSGIANRIVSGWGATGITTLQSGYPLALTATANDLVNFFGAGTLRPNYVGGCSQVTSGSAQQRLTAWFNTACFTEPAATSFGNLGRTDPALRGPGVANWDFSIFKKTPITERVTLDFRAEFFNIFNRVQFSNPGNTLNPSLLNTPGNTFGVISAQYNLPRLMQATARVTF